MNTYAILVVNDHFQSLVAEAQHDQLVRSIDRPGLRARIASRLASVRHTGRTVDQTGSSLSFVPKLEDYPSRS